MNIRQLANEVSKQTNMTQLEAYKMMTVVIEIIVQQILKGQIVKLRMFGTFYADIAEENKFYNPITKKIEIKKRRYVLKYSISRFLRKRLDDKRTY